jgi:hypothetical protein
VGQQVLYQIVVEPQMDFVPAKSRQVCLGFLASHDPSPHLHAGNRIFRQVIGVLAKNPILGPIRHATDFPRKWIM